MLNKNFDKLLSLLSGENKRLLIAIEDMNNSLRAISNEACYCKGFSDCIKVIAYSELD